MNARMSVVVLLLSLAACGGGDGGSDGGTDGGTNGGTDGGTDGGTNGGTDGGNWQVPDDAPLIDIESEFLTGPLTVKGAIQLPEDTRIGVYTVFEFDQFTGDRLDSVFASLGPFTTGSRYMRFVIKGLEDGSYKFHFFVDQDNNGDIDSGDYAGWYAGTVEHPVLNSTEATPLNLEGRDHEGINFGIGRKR